jgi:hypothetical protein
MHKGIYTQRRIYYTRKGYNRGVNTTGEWEQQRSEHDRGVNISSEE